MSQPASRPLVTFKIGDQPVPGYRLVRELGRGTFGVVWLAVTDNGFERAIKVVNLEQRGGKKEFRALRLIKDRKILHGNLLMLVDYWLLDREGTILNTATDPGLESQIAPSPKPVAGGSKLKTDTGPQVQVTNLAALRQGTMMPGGDADMPLSVRDTFQQQQRMSDTRDEEHSQAVWLVVAMELGHKTLHDRQKEYTAEQRAKLPNAARKGATQVDRQGDTAPGSHTVADHRSTGQGQDDEELTPLPADEILPYMEQAARGLDHLHRCDIVHRDVKPQNIMLVGDVAKVCDYGLASELNVDLGATTNAFTLPFAAPEAINKKPVPSSDQYSLAVTYVELRTGRWPFASNTETAVYAAKDTGLHDLRSVRKRAVRAVLKKALAKNPADRYATCGDFVKELTKAEHAKSSFFAVAQASLASLALVLVLMLALLTHPDIRAFILAHIPGSAIIPPPPPPPPPLDIPWEKYIRDLARAEQFLANKKFKEAKDEFAALTRAEPQLPSDPAGYEKLFQLHPQVPSTEAGLRAAAYLGLARTQLGDPSAEETKQPIPSKSEIEETLEKLAKRVPAAAMPDSQQMRLYYLQSALNPRSDLKTYEPDSELAKSWLSDWERTLWKDLSRPVEFTTLLGELVAQRKDGRLEEAWATHEKLTTAAEHERFLPSDLHRLELEKIHLTHLGEDVPSDVTLADLRKYVDTVKSVDRRLVDRAQLLQLLVLYKLKQGQPFTFFDSDVCQLIASARTQLFVLDSDQNDLSTKETDAIRALRQAFRQDVLKYPLPIPSTTEEPAFEAVCHLFSPEEGLQLLMRRARDQLDGKEPVATRVPAFLAAWGDLQKYVKTVYPDDTLTATDSEELADLSLDAALADESTGIAQAAEFGRLIRKIKPARQVEWFNRLLTKAEKERTWTAAITSPLRELVNDPPRGLKNDPKQLQDWEKRLAALEMQAVLHLDPKTNSAELQAKLDRLPKGAVADLLRVELELLGDPEPTSNRLEIWAGRASRAKGSLGSTDPEAESYADYLLSRLQGAQGAGLSDAQVTSLLDLFQRSPPPGWFNASREADAKDLLSLLALKWLTLDDASNTRLDDRLVLKFSSLPAIETPRLTKLRELTARLGMAPPLVSVIEAIRTATRGKDADWEQIHQILSKHKPAVFEAFQKQRAGRMFDYVLLLSAIKRPDAGAVDEATILGFAALLESPPATGGDAYFTFAGPSTTTDEGILRNIVNPALSAIGDSADKRSAEATQALAKLWGAKGRLLQRSYGIVVVEDRQDMMSKDLVLASSTIASQAFAQARKLDPKNINYAVGLGRTILNLPPHLQDKQTLRAIVKEFDPDGTSTDPGMQYLSATLLRTEAYGDNDRISNRSSLDGAIEKLKALLAATPDDDPWQLRAPCLESLSDMHLHLAFSTPSFSLADVDDLESGRIPPKGTKPYFLYYAAYYAEAQKSIPNRLKPENAAINLANAYEDYAFYLRIPDYFERSIDEFRSAIELARQQGRDVAGPQMNFGRAIYRYSIDPLVDHPSYAKRLELHQEAELHLREAIGPGTTLSFSNQAQVKMWLAQNLNARFLLRDKDPALVDKPLDALKLLEEAIAQIGDAAALEAKHGSTYYAFMYRAIQLERMVGLASFTKPLVPSQIPMAKIKEYSNQIEAIEEEAFRMAVQFQSSDAFRPDDLLTFAEFAGWREQEANVWQRNQAFYNRWVSDRAIRSVWGLSSRLRYEEFLVRLNRAQEFENLGMASSVTDGELSLARTIATELEASSPELALYAKGKLADRDALHACRRIRAAAAGANQALLQAYIDAIPVLAESKRLRDEIIKRNPEKEFIFQTITSTKCDDLGDLEFTLTNAERRKLTEELRQLSANEISAQTGIACLLLFERSATAPVPNFDKLKLARLAHNTLKLHFAQSARNGALSGEQASRLNRVKDVENYLIENNAFPMRPTRPPRPMPMAEGMK